MRAALPQGERMLGSWNGTTAVATVGGREFTDLAELLEICDGDAATIEPGAEVEIGEEELLSVAASPPKIVCIGLNSRSHAEDSGPPLPAKPILFPKWS